MCKQNANGKAGADLMGRAEEPLRDELHMNCEALKTENKERAGGRSRSGCRIT